MQRLDNLVDAAGENLRQIVPGFVEPMVGHAVLEIIVGADFFGAVAGAYPRLARLPRARLSLFLRAGARASRIKSASLFRDSPAGCVPKKNAPRCRSVCGRAAPPSRLCSHSVRPRRRFGRIPSGFGGIDIYVRLRANRQNGDRCGRGVDAPRLFRRRHALNAMHAGFVAQRVIRIGTGNFKRKVVENARFPSAALGILLIHLFQIARKNRRLVAAGARAQLHHDGTAARPFLFLFALRADSPRNPFI